MKRSLTLLVFLAVLGLAATAPAVLSDFKVRGQVTLPGAPGRLAVTPDDRFVLVLQPAAKAIAVVDTWNFSPLGGSISLSRPPVSITLTPNGDTAYVTMTNGKIAKVDLSSLAGLGLNAALTLTATDLSLEFADSLGDIAAVPWGGSATDSCVFVIDGTGLKWFQESAPGTSPSDLAPTNCNAREVEGGGKYAFVLCDNSTTSKADLRQYECTASGPLDRTTIFLALGAIGGFQSLSLAPNSDWLVVGDSIDKTITLIGADSVTPGTIVIAGSTSTQTLGMRDILATDFASDSPVAFTVSNDKLVLAQIDAPINQFSGNYSSLTLPKTGGGFLARSTPSDQYVYLSLAGGSTVAVVTANPWVEITDASLKSGDTTGTGTLTISFASDKAGHYVINKDTGFKTGTMLAGGTVQTAGEKVTKTFKLTGLTEDQTIYAVEVTDSANRKGRNAVAVQSNLAPVPQNFSLDFGTAKLIIKFTVQSRKDLDYMKIYYGTNCDGDTLDYSSITGGDGKPPSPITISSPTAGQKISKVVEGLQYDETNGTKYCVQIATFDKSGRFSISARKSILVEQAFTLTQLAKEKGGFHCLGALAPGAGFRESGAWVAAVPWLLIWLVRIKRRWGILRGSSRRGR